MKEHEPYWVTEARPVPPEEMVRRIQAMAKEPGPLPEPGTENLFGEVWMEESIRADLSLGLARLADIASSFARKLEEDQK